METEVDAPVGACIRKRLGEIVDFGGIPYIYCWSISSGYISIGKLEVVAQLCRFELPVSSTRGSIMGKTKSRVVSRVVCSDVFQRRYC